MKLNDFAKDPHIAVEAYNETLKNWKQIKQWPSGIDGPLGWSQSSCEIVIPESTNKIRLAFNAVWSSQAKEQAKTFFDDIYLID